MVTGSGGIGGKRNETKPNFLHNKLLEYFGISNVSMGNFFWRLNLPHHLDYPVSQEQAASNGAWPDDCNETTPETQIPFRSRIRTSSCLQEFVGRIIGCKLCWVTLSWVQNKSAHYSRFNRLHGINGCKRFHQSRFFLLSNIRRRLLIKRRSFLLTAPSRPACKLGETRLSGGL